MSNGGPEFAALQQLETVLAHVTTELASWRRRAHKAESERSELGVDHDAVAARERIVELEAENRELEERLELARRRATDLLSRLQFLEQQVALEEANR